MGQRVVRDYTSFARRLSSLAAPPNNTLSVGLTSTRERIQFTQRQVEYVKCCLLESMVGHSQYCMETYLGGSEYTAFTTW